MTTGVSGHARAIAPGLYIEGLGFAFPGAENLFDNFTLALDAGVTAILGGSGAGKSTLLRLIAGRLTPSKGAIQGVAERRIAWMGQSGGLLPWASAEDNLLLGARLRGEAPNRPQARALLTRMGLAGDTAKRPAEMSGGMRQRVALARALMEDAQIVLLDEPFAHLDAITRTRLYELCARELDDRIAVMVTHDPLEALTLAQRCIVVGGRPARVQCDEKLNGGTPRDPRDPGLNAVYARIVAALEAA